MAKSMRRKNLSLQFKPFIYRLQNPKQLRQHLTEGGKIVPRRITGVSAKYQRQISEINQACTSARTLAIYSNESRSRHKDFLQGVSSWALWAMSSRFVTVRS